MDHASATRETFNAYAEGYEEKFNQNILGQYQRKTVHRSIAPFLRSGDAILDVGCGPGSDFAFYKSLQLKVDAIDISPEMAKLASRTAAELDLSAKIENVPLADFRTENQYDLIILNFGVVNLFQNLPEALQQLNSMLKQDGALVIVSMPPFHFFSMLGDLLTLRTPSLVNRILHKEAAVANGLKFFYYTKKDFQTHFKIVKSIHLCWCLPTPDQHAGNKMARWTAKLLIKIDSRLQHAVPDFLGGDHICYICRALET